MSHKPIVSILLRTCAAFALALIALAACTQSAAAPPAAQVPHFWSDPTLRMIVIAAPGDQLAKKGDILLTNLVEGRLPAGASQATVLSDSNCDPDAQGISHCFNQLQIGDTVLTVQHHHDMTKVPCLGPGEKVNIMDVRTYQNL